MLNFNFLKQKRIFVFFLLFFMLFNFMIPSKPAHAFVPAVIVGTELGYVVAQTMVAAGLGFSIANKKAIESALTGYWQSVGNDIKEKWVNGVNAGQFAYNVTSILWDSLKGYVQSTYLPGNNNVTYGHEVSGYAFDMVGVNLGSEFYVANRLHYYTPYLVYCLPNPDNTYFNVMGKKGNSEYSLKSYSMYPYYDYSKFYFSIGLSNNVLQYSLYLYSYSSSDYVLYDYFTSQVAGFGLYEDTLINSSYFVDYTLIGESGVIDVPEWDWASPSDPQGRKMVGIPVPDFPLGFSEGVGEVASNVWDKLIDGLAGKTSADVISSPLVTTDVPVGFFDAILSRVQSMASSIAGILEGLSFYPSQEFMIGFYEDISLEFNKKIPLFSQLKLLWDSLFGVSYGEEIPEFNITLPSKWGGTTHSVLDFDYFTEYRGLIVNFIRFTAWFIFLKRLYRRLPSVIYN